MTKEKLKEYNHKYYLENKSKIKERLAKRRDKINEYARKYYSQKKQRFADLERENRTIKSLLYCTVKSCNNCGKVNCENFQRQRKNYCENWVSYKDYIKELERLNSNQAESLRVTMLEEEKKGKCIEELEMENTELKKEAVFFHTEKGEYKSAFIKEVLKKNKIKKNLTKAKELLNEFMRISKASDEDFEHDYSELIGETEQFIKDLEK